MHVGIRATRRKQPVIINAEIYLDGDTRWKKDDIKQTLSYENIDKRIRFREANIFQFAGDVSGIYRRGFSASTRCAELASRTEKPFDREERKSAGVRITRYKA